MKPALRILILFWIFLPEIVFGQLDSSARQHPWPAIGEKGKDYHINSKDKPDGLHYRTYGDGAIYYSGQFRNGKPKGGTSFFYYHPDGKIMAVHAFDRNPDRVKAELFNIEGIKVSNGLYVKQKKDSVWTFYDAGGRVTSREAYANDVKNGQYEVYFALTGKPVETGTYKDGLEEGEFVKYFESGRRKSISYFTAGKQQGHFVDFEESGAKSLEGEYKDGLKVAVWSYFLPSGRLQKRVKYEFGEEVKTIPENGDFIEYYPNGVPRSEMEYKEGKPHGPFKEYYEMGEFVKIQETIEGAGLQWKEKLTGTQVRLEGDYKNGLYEGEIKYYTEKGLSEKVELYREGELIETRPR